MDEHLFFLLFCEMFGMSLPLAQESQLKWKFGINASVCGAAIAAAAQDIKETGDFLLVRTRLKVVVAHVLRKEWYDWQS